jgi:phosphatidylethanolamine-binding protein (PEBP) family uncharacterized protein
LNGGFYGEVTERNDQVDPQPRAQPLREALPPMRGAKIVGFSSPRPKSYHLTYEVNGRQGHVNYVIAANGSVAFKFTDPAGNSTAETYTPREPGGGGRDGDDRRPPRSPGDNRPPREGQRPPPRNDESVAYKPRSDLPQLVVTSSALDAAGNISAEFTCDGASASPPVEWTGAPKQTKYFALSLWHTAPDQEKSYWIIYNIPADTTQLPKNAHGIGTMGLNDRRRPAYDPMCSKGPGLKTYHITVFALSAKPNLSSDKATRANLLTAIKNTTLAEGTLTFQYERPNRN